MNRVEQKETVKFRSILGTLLVGIVIPVAIVYFVAAELVDQPSVGSTIVGGLSVLAACFIAFSQLRAPALMTDHELIVRGAIRTHRIDIDSIRGVEIARDSLGEVPRVVLKDGNHIDVNGLRMMIWRSSHIRDDVQNMSRLVEARQS